MPVVTVRYFVFPACAKLGGDGFQLRDDMLPDGARGDLYEVRQVGDGRGLARALCPAASQVWLAIGRVRAARPLSMQAVGLWPDGKYHHCAALSYEWRGEWATRPPGGGGNP